MSQHILAGQTGISPVPAATAKDEEGLAPLAERPVNTARFYSTRTEQAETTQIAALTIQQETANVLEETRTNAQCTVARCRSIISSLEANRMYKSRMGWSQWMSFWEAMYDRQFSRAISIRVTNALSKVNQLFQLVSTDLQTLAAGTQDAVNRAASEWDTLKALEDFEKEVGVIRRRRRKRARSILERLRNSLEALPAGVSDELFDDMKRAVFALDYLYDYHPGDAEREAYDRMWPERLRQEQSRQLAESLYRRPTQVQGQSAASPLHYPTRMPADPTANYYEDIDFDDNELLRRHPTAESSERLVVGGDCSIVCV